MNSLDLSRAIKRLYPQALPSRDYLVRSTSKDEAAIAHWTPSNPAWTQPTLEQLAAALVPAPLPVPTLTARQLRLWLLSNGLTPEMIDAQIAAIPDGAAQARAKVEWEYATEYRREHPLVTQVGTSLHLTSEQIDSAFRAAALL